MFKKILIIGAGVEQVEAIKIAKEMGHYVIVTDMNKNAPGIIFADKFYKISTTDSKGNIDIGKKEKINGVMTVCSETAVPTVAIVADELGLKSFTRKTALFATDKSEMRKVLLNRRIDVSPFIIAKCFKEVAGFVENNEGPWVLKPVDNSGQRGSSVINKKELLEQAFTNAMKNSFIKKVLVDRFIKGPEIHVTMQVVNNKAHFLAISDRITLDKNNFGIAVRHIGPSIIDDQLENRIKFLCQESIKAIKLENGVATCELIIQNEIPYLMELAIRVPGGYLREVALYLSGIDIYKTTIWNCIGENKEYKEMITADFYNAVSVKFISSLNVNKQVSVIKDISGNSILDKSNIKIIKFHFETEYEFPKLKNSVGRFSAIIGVGNTRKEAVKSTEIAFNSIKFNDFYLIEYTSYNEYCTNFKHYLN